MALEKFLRQKGAVINEGRVTIKKDCLGLRLERGGGGKASGYKINPLFFVRMKDCTEDGDAVLFDLDHVQQLNPTITGKVFFDTLKYADVKEYYSL